VCVFVLIYMRVGCKVLDVTVCCQCVANVLPMCC
jgi:hypothetical protein